MRIYVCIEYIESLASGLFTILPSSPLPRPPYFFFFFIAWWHHIRATNYSSNRIEKIIKDSTILSSRQLIISRSFRKIYLHRFQRIINAIFFFFSYWHHIRATNYSSNRIEKIIKDSTILSSRQFFLLDN